MERLEVEDVDGTVHGVAVDNEVLMVIGDVQLGELAKGEVGDGGGLSALP